MGNILHSTTASNDIDFIKKGNNKRIDGDIDWFNSSEYFSHSGFSNAAAEVNDSLDICSYRIIQSYAVNKVNKHMETMDFSLSDEFSDDDLSIIEMEDTLDICNYRQNCSTKRQNSQNSDIQTSHDVVAEYLVETEKTSELSVQLNDTMNVCYYRNSSAHPITPERHSYYIARCFNKCVVPYALSLSPILKTNSSIQ